jgi:hypothetical protein
MEVLKPVLGRKKTRSDFNEKNLSFENDIENDIDKFSGLKNQNKFFHPVPRLILNNGSRIRDVNFQQFFEILEKFFLNNLEVVVTFAKELSSKNSYEFRRLNIELCTSRMVRTCS